MACRFPLSRASAPRRPCSLAPVEHRRGHPRAGVGGISRTARRELLRPASRDQGVRRSRVGTVLVCLRGPRDGVDHPCGRGRPVLVDWPAWVSDAWHGGRWVPLSARPAQDGLRWRLRTPPQTEAGLHGADRAPEYLVADDVTSLRRAVAAVSRTAW